MALPNRSEIHDAIIGVLAQQPDGAARPRDIYPAITDRFHISSTELTARLKSGINRWTNRIQFARWDLVRTGYLERDTPGVWKLTDLGWRRARGEDVEPLVVDVPPSPPDDDAVKRPVVLTSHAESIVAALEDAQHNSTTPQRFEIAVLDAFQFLGFEVEHVGGAGDTDIVADAPLGVARYRFIIDAKSTARETVPDAQINWLTIDAHRKTRGAEFAVIVGPSFAGGNLKRYADEYSVTLLPTPRLVELVRLHEATPFTLDELRLVFVRRADPTAFDELRSASQRSLRRWLLLSSVIDQVDTWNQLRPNAVLAQPIALFTSLISPGDDALRGLTLSEVEDAVLVLNSGTMGILRSANDDGGAGGYVLTTSRAGARRRLAAMTRTLVDLGSRLTESEVGHRHGQVETGVWEASVRDEPDGA